MAKQLLKPIPRRTSAICSPRYLSPIDYVYPFLINVTFDCLLLSAVALLYAAAHPESAAILMILALQVIVAIVALDAVSALASSGYYHFVWMKHLRREGAEAFQTQIELPLSKHQAFELALAATAQIKNGRICSMNEGAGDLQVWSKGRWWQMSDRCVDISISETGTGSSVTIASYAALSDWRQAMLLFFWGRKWLPILTSLDVRRNKRVSNMLAEFMRQTPNWDYHHIPTELDEDLKRLQSDVGFA